MPPEVRAIISSMFLVAAGLALFVDRRADNRKPNGYFLANWVISTFLCTPSGELRPFVKPLFVLGGLLLAGAMWFIP